MMRPFLRLLGAAALFVVLLATCSTPFISQPAPRISGFVAESSAGSPIRPTVQPSVTPIGGGEQAASAQATPTIALPDAPAPLSANMAPAPAAPLSLAGVAAQMDAEMQAAVAGGTFSGVALVARGDEIIFAKGYGMADATNGAAITPATRFRLASVSKAITAIAMMQLVADGKIDLNASICNYLRQCGAAWGSVLVRHLLTHTSGIPNYTDFANFAEVEQLPATPDQVIDRFRGLPLGFAPGSAYQYCNSNYVLLGRIIEEVSVQYYPDFLRDRIFAPLRMNDSGYDSGNATALNGTRGYVTPGVPSIALDSSNLFAAGGLYSSAEDLLKLARALDNNTILPAEQAAQMYAPLYFNYGYGWKIEQRYGRRVIYHPGYMSGAATYFGRYPEDQVTVIILANSESANVVGLADRLAGMVFAP
ncbi:MAG: beta-lactamase family protein [Oscillochloris sp.]|nr:beta-lactamase family protein [Oscillochloris sp.]